MKGYHVEFTNALIDGWVRLDIWTFAIFHAAGGCKGQRDTEREREKIKSFAGINIRTKLIMQGFGVSRASMQQYMPCALPMGKSPFATAVWLQARDRTRLQLEKVLCRPCTTWPEHPCGG